MKRNPENQIHNLSYNAIREVAWDFELDNETKERIYAKTLRRTGVRRKPLALSTQPAPVVTTIASRSAHRGGFKKPAIAVAAVALAFSVSMGTIVGAGALNKTFGQYFHSLSEQNYQNVLFDINKTVSDNGISVTLTQAMCDGVSLYVIEKVEFDPSVLTLTDDMFQVDEHGNCSAPRWGYDTLINDKETAALDTATTGSIVERNSSFQQILEHDEHSITYLRIFGGQDVLEKDDFFTDGKQFTVRYSDMVVVTEKRIQSSIDISFDMGTVSSPAYYTLPEETYLTLDAKTDEMADMIINPWNMRLAPGGFTGKVLNTDLKKEGVPAVSITMKDGTVYSDGSGITMYQDPFGETYDAYDGIYCEFATPIDVNEIQSVKLYGYEMKQGLVAPDKSKETAFDTSAYMLDLPAESAVKFTNTPTTVNYRILDYNNPNSGYWGDDYGQFKYKINGVKVYDNAYATGAKSADDLGCDARQGLDWNEKTGQLGDGWYLLEYEVELTNINARFDESLSTFDFTGSGCFEQLFHLHSFNALKPGSWDVYMEGYIRENQYALTGQHETIHLPVGETQTFHVGFIVKDNHAGGFQEIGLSVGNDLGEGKVQYHNITKVIEDFKKSKS